MCGIIGYTGPLEAKKLLLEGLAGLEYQAMTAQAWHFSTRTRISA